MWLLVSFKNCWRQYRQTQSIAPQTHRWVGQLKLNPEQLVVLAQLIETNNDATLEKLGDLLHQKIGITISFGHNGKNDIKLVRHSLVDRVSLSKSFTKICVAQLRDDLCYHT